MSEKQPVFGHALSAVFLFIAPGCPKCNPLSGLLGMEHIGIAKNSLDF